MEAAASLCAPESLHLPLFYQLAARGVATYSPMLHVRSVSDTKVTPKWAVWRLAQNLKQLSMVDSPAEFSSVRSEGVNEGSELDFSGLPGTVASGVQSMLSASETLLSALLLPSAKSRNQALRAYIDCCTSLMHQDGASGWLGYSCASLILEDIIPIWSHFREAHVPNRGIGPRARLIHEMAQEIPQLASLYEQLWQYAFGDNATDDIRSTAGPKAISELLYYLNVSVVPPHIRVNGHEQLQPTTSIVAAAIHGDSIAPLGWLLEVPFPTAFIPEISEKCSAHLEAMLKMFSQMSFRAPNLMRDVPTLRVPMIQKILKVVRSNDDPSILQGALVALSTSKYLRIAGVELVLRMLRVCADGTSFGIDLFRRVELSYLRGDIKYSANYADILLQIAAKVIAEPESFPQPIVTHAADYLAQNSSVKLHPLLDEASNLGMGVRK